MLNIICQLYTSSFKFNVTVPESGSFPEIFLLLSELHRVMQANLLPTTILCPRYSTLQVSCRLKKVNRQWF